MGTKEEGERADAHVFQFDLVPKFPCSLQMEAKNPLLPICKHFPPLLLLLVGHGRSALMLLPFLPLPPMPTAAAASSLEARRREFMPAARCAAASAPPVASIL